MPVEPLLQLRTSLADRYEIEREIGVGGMATVYLARDLRHDRNVALKVLRPDLGAVLGVERFLSEIKVTANLQHPNLLPLFDSGEADGLLFYVMPYVEGESLRARLDREKQVPVEEAIRISVAIANALDYAHSQGVIHRDLKPENILLQFNQPVIADFGIALAVSKAGGNRITQTGLSLGTPSYMSPEQATGDRVVDARSDIYSLGAMTYEMLTGEPPHTGNTSQAVIARMLTEKPRPIRTTRAAVPDYVEATVQRALEKLPADRFSNVREFADGLQGRLDLAASTALTSARKAAGSQRAGWQQRLRDPVVLPLAALLLIVVGAAAFRERSRPAGQRPIRFVLATPDSARAVANFPWPGAISPDGSTIVYSARGGAAAAALYALKTDQLEARAIPATAGAGQPVFSPDGRWLAFEANGKLRKVQLDGSAPITITDAGSSNGADWTSRDEIILGSESNNHGLSRVRASGGEMVEFSKPDKSKGETDYLWPIAFPSGKMVVFTIWSGALVSSRLATASLDDGNVMPLNIRGIRPLAVIDRTLIYLQIDGSVMAVTLDRSGRRVSGQPRPVLDPVNVEQGLNGNSEIFVSSRGALLTSRGGTNSQLAWMAPDGTTKIISQETRQFAVPRLSPDGGRIAVAVGDQEKSAIWIYDLGTSTFSRLSSAEAATSPSWTPDSKKVVYLALGDGERFAVWSQNADGGSSAEKLFDVPYLTPGVTISPDGRSVLAISYSDVAWQLYRTALDSTRVTIPYLANRGIDATHPSFSPNGKWVAVTSLESGRPEVSIRSFPDPSARVLISAGRGSGPAWSADGTRVFYANGRVIMSARLATTPGLRVISRDTVTASAPAGIGGLLLRNYDVARDGRFLTLISNRNDFQIVVVPNWLPELKQRLAGHR
ncbi:MAG: protein kinase [Gemmatimonadaceae bacterium]